MSFLKKIFKKSPKNKDKGKNAGNNSYEEPDYHEAPQQQQRFEGGSTGVPSQPVQGEFVLQQQPQQQQAIPPLNASNDASNMGIGAAGGGVGESRTFASYGDSSSSAQYGGVRSVEYGALGEQYSAVPIQGLEQATTGTSAPMQHISQPEVDIVYPAVALPQQHVLPVQAVPISHESTATFATIPTAATGEVFRVQLQGEVVPLSAIGARLEGTQQPQFRFFASKEFKDDLDKTVSKRSKGIRKAIAAFEKRWNQGPVGTLSRYRFFATKDFQKELDKAVSKRGKSIRKSIDAFEQKWNEHQVAALRRSRPFSSDGFKQELKAMVDKRGLAYRTAVWHMDEKLSQKFMRSLQPYRYFSSIEFKDDLGRVLLRRSPNFAKAAAESDIKFRKALPLPSAGAGQSSEQMPPIKEGLDIEQDKIREQRIPTMLPGATEGFLGREGQFPPMHGADTYAETKQFETAPVTGVIALVEEQPSSSTQMAPASLSSGYSAEVLSRDRDYNYGQTASLADQIKDTIGVRNTGAQKTLFPEAPSTSSANVSSAAVFSTDRDYAHGLKPSITDKVKDKLGVANTGPHVPSADIISRDRDRNYTGVDSTTDKLKDKLGVSSVGPQKDITTDEALGGAQVPTATAKVFSRDRDYDHGLPASFADTVKDKLGVANTGPAPPTASILSRDRDYNYGREASLTDKIKDTVGVANVGPQKATTVSDAALMAPPVAGLTGSETSAWPEDDQTGFASSGPDVKLAKAATFSRDRDYDHGNAPSITDKVKDTLGVSNVGPQKPTADVLSRDRDYNYGREPSLTDKAKDALGVSNTGAQKISVADSFVEPKPITQSIKESAIVAKEKAAASLSAAGAKLGLSGDSKTDDSAAAGAASDSVNWPMMRSPGPTVNRAMQDLKGSTPQTWSSTSFEPPSQAGPVGGSFNMGPSANESFMKSGDFSGSRTRSDDSAAIPPAPPVPSEDAVPPPLREGHFVTDPDPLSAVKKSAHLHQQQEIVAPVSYATGDIENATVLPLSGESVTVLGAPTVVVMEGATVSEAAPSWSDIASKSSSGSQVQKKTWNSGEQQSDKNFSKQGELSATSGPVASPAAPIKALASGKRK